MPTLAEIRRENSVGAEDVERMARALYRAKARTYRETLLFLLHTYGSLDRKRVTLGLDMREALMQQATDHAKLIARGHNEWMERQISKLRAKGFSNDLIAKALPRYMRERVRGRAEAIARHESTLAHLDAQVQFFRENGVEPMFDIIGPRANSCPLCTALFRGNPWPIEAVLKIGYPHMHCRHSWRARGVTRRDLLPGGARPKQISAGRTLPVGIGDEQPYGHRFPSNEAAVAGLKQLFAAERDHETFAVAVAQPRDGDGDGMVYDGTPRERPAVDLSDLPDGTWITYQSRYSSQYPDVIGRIEGRQDTDGFGTDATFYRVREYPLGSLIELIDRGVERVLDPDEVERAERKFITDPDQDKAVSAYASPNTYQQVQAVARGAVANRGPVRKELADAYGLTVAELERTIAAKGFSREGEIVYRRTAEEFIPPVGQEVALHGFFSVTGDLEVALNIGGITQGQDAPILILSVETDRPALDLHAQWGQQPHEYVFGQNTRIYIEEVKVNPRTGLKTYYGRILG